MNVNKNYQGFESFLQTLLLSVQLESRYTVNILWMSVVSNLMEGKTFVWRDDTIMADSSELGMRSGNSSNALFPISPCEQAILPMTNEL